MKTNLFILITILITNLNCQDTSFKSEGIWVGIYSLLDKSSRIEKFEEEFYDDTIRLTKILYFKEDSLFLTNFNETFYYGFDKHSFKYSLKKDSLKIGYNDKEASIYYFYDNKGFLYLDFKEDGRIKYKDYFVQIEEFGMSLKEKEIGSFLTSSPVIIGQRADKIELTPSHWHHMGEFIQDSLEANYGYGNDWYFCSIDKELFLIIGDYVIHVSKFDNDKIYGFTYDRKVSDIEIRKSNYPRKFDLELLIGNWVVKDDRELSTGQTIEITDNQIIVNSKNFSDSLVWSLNKYGNKILIGNDHFERHGKLWKIENLSKNEILVKRKVGEPREYKIEILTLEKE